MEYENQFNWTVGSMNAGASHTIAVTLQDSFVNTGTINLSGPWKAAFTAGKTKSATREAKTDRKLLRLESVPLEIRIPPSA